MPLDNPGKLARKPGWGPTLPGWISAALSGCVGLSECFGHAAHGGGRSCLHIQSRRLRTKILERQEEDARRREGGRFPTVIYTAQKEVRQRRRAVHAIGMQKPGPSRESSRKTTGNILP